MRNTKHFIILALLIVILTMAVGYSSFASQLTVNGTAEIIGEWNVKIVDIKAQEVSAGCDAGTPEYTDTNVNFAAKLQKPGDSITYVLTIENAGNIDAVLDSANFNEQEDGSDAIIYTNTKPDTLLKAGQQTTCTIKITYDPSTTEIPFIKTKTLTGTIEYVQNN